MSSSSADSIKCAAPWSALIAVFAAIAAIVIFYVVSLSIEVNRRNKDCAKWAAFQAHLRNIASLRRRAYQLRDALQSALGTSATVSVFGSALTGSMTDTSDIDLDVSAKSNEAYLQAGSVLELAGFTHVHSGGTYALYQKQGPDGRIVDVALHVGHDESTPTHTDKQLAEARGYLEWVIKNDNPGVKIRRKKPPTASASPSTAP